ncbi:MAG: electron transfer flavoprotein subunit alpha [Candidatus Omnitrophica bacterium]|nr:electron transfer flavoprotein subunit alpha [Candidatus Omnitrophota bacterium]
MEKILYLAHTQAGGTLPKVAFEILNAAVEISRNLAGSNLTVGLLGEQIDAAANSIAGCGALKFFGVTGSEFAVSRYASDAAALEALARKSGATLILAPATSRFSRAMPGVAHRLNGRIDTHVSGLKVTNGSLEIQRWYYRQRMMATLTRATRPWILLIDSGIFQPWSGAPGSAAVESVAVQLSPNYLKTRVLGVEAASGDAETIRPDAKLLFVAGAGWTKKQSDGQTHVKEAEQLILNFLNCTQASLGSSKSLVDQGSEGEAVLSFLSHLNQVGQTGSTPRHPKGLATCCHGEEPHVVGWRFINERRAVNLDPNCGWAQGKADVLYVADAFRVIEKINELLSKN